MVIFEIFARKESVHEVWLGNDHDFSNPSFGLVNSCHRVVDPKSTKPKEQTLPTNDCSTKKS